MNIIDIILLAILAIAFISGMQKGFLASLLATFAFVGAWVIALSVYPAVSERFMGSQFRAWLDGNVDFDALLEGVDVGKNLCESVVNQLNAIAQTLTSHNVPAAIVDLFKTNFAANSGLTVSSYLSQTIWQAVFNVVSFAIVFALSYAALLLIVNLLNNMFRIPKLRGVDALLGGVLGAVRGYVVICLVVAIIPMVLTALDSSVIETMLDGSTVGKFFVDGKSVFSDLFGVGGQLSGIISKI